MSILLPTQTVVTSYIEKNKLFYDGLKDLNDYSKIILDLTDYSKIIIDLSECTISEEKNIQNKVININKNELSYEGLTDLNDSSTTIEESSKCNVSKNIQNKGIGAGGSNTNKNGLSYEKLTDLNDCFTTIEKEKFSSKIKFNKHEKILIRTKKTDFFKCMKKNINENVKKAHGCKSPDECYIDEDKKTIFVIEKKFQQVPGSVCEKIQTPDFKIWQYNRTFPEYNIVYIYCLSEWFKKNCEAEMEYLNFKQIPVFWGNSKTYKDEIISFIINYK